MKNPAHLRRLFAQWVIITFSISVLLFVAAGTTQVPSLRNYLATLLAFLLAAMLIIDPGLAKERSGTLENQGTPGRFAASLSFLATLVTAAFDVGRLHWLNNLPIEARAIGLDSFAAAMALEIWAMVVNPFFSPEIRLQLERGHQLVDRGPYRLLRHPGYLAMLWAVPASALAIGSWLALVPAAAFCLAIVRRVGAEEEFLREQLPGYHDYMARVRGRLFPRPDLRGHGFEKQISSNFELRDSDRRQP